MNLKKPSIQVLQAFTNLRVNEDFGTILEWLRENRKTARDELERHTDEDLFARVQGRSQTLKEFLELSYTASKQLEKQQTRVNQNESRKRTAQGSKRSDRSSG